VSTTFYIPDPFITWIIRQAARTLAALLAIGIIAFVASIMFRAIALMIDALHGALHSVLLVCISLNHLYIQSGLVGQFLLICLMSAGLLFVIYRGWRFLYHTFRGGVA
jgi:hypothetical protein